ncbi:hypothetical protein B0T26DRAFT_729064 [Lasiosphaeria miniovina]|uniref:FluG domain-containing protein n=1 Tax=Lasiosphaeria miniovina TaxID=1954250 RepID=A0AA40DKI8_9PEZI|nr:uncharacterized protein B0T26DRAFT_729064 [Lasiosphaeria miniovina]KAK0707074.1 hypothetical protein B0T26DRAFT_729064 [Lasiosphaeria miniovina]
MAPLTPPIIPGLSTDIVRVNSPRHSTSGTWHDTVLIPKYNLQATNTFGKDVANVDTLLVLLTFNIQYDTSIFPWEGHRIQLPGCYLSLAFTGGRPAEFVDGEKRSDDDECLKELFSYISTGSDGDKAPDENSTVLEEMISQEHKDRGRPKALCYEDIQLMVVRHPETGDEGLAMAIRLAHHKGVDNKPKPTIFFFTPARRLIFCFITIIVSLAVHDGAFAALKFTSVRGVFETRNKGPVKCTPLRWKEEWLKRPVFRRYDESIAEEESEERKYQPLPYHKLRYDMERQSLDAGEENSIEPKAWRRGAANAADGNASDAVRDQMMRHDPKWATFNNAYINEKVGFHLQNAFLEEPTEDSLLAMLTHIGLTRDPRASKDMVPDDVWELMLPDPQIEALKAERAQLKGGRHRIKGSKNEGKIRELTKWIATKEQQRKTTIRREYRKHYFYNRPTWDMDADGQEEYVKPAADLQITERAQLAEILYNQPDNLGLAELLELRIRAGELVVILCGKRETARRGRIRRRAQAQADVTVKESPGPDLFPYKINKRQCPRCIGDEMLTYEERTFKYYRLAVMHDHFDRNHAQYLDSVEQISYNHPKCKDEALGFKHLSHYKNHIQKVHGVKLRA